MNLFKFDDFKSRDLPAIVKLYDEERISAQWRRKSGKFVIITVRIDNSMSSITQFSLIIICSSYLGGYLCVQLEHELLAGGVSGGEAGHEVPGLGEVSLHPQALSVHISEIDTGLHNIALSGFFEPKGRLLGVLLAALARHQMAAGIECGR